MRKNLAFYFRLNPAIPYPSEEVRTNIMRPYISEIFKEFFENVIIQWSENEGKLNEIIVIGDSPRFYYDERGEFLFLLFLFSSVTWRLDKLFSQFGGKIEKPDIFELTKSLEEYSADVILAKLDKKKIKFNDYFGPFFVKINLEGKMVIKLKQTERRELEIKNLLKTLREMKIGNFRINPNNKNVIEIKDKKTGKWRPIYIFEDSNYFAYFVRTKEEWIKTLITILGVTTVPWVIIMSNSSSFLNFLLAILFIPIWIMFVWVIFPKLKSGI